MATPRVSPHLALFLCVSLLAHSSHGARIPHTAPVTDNTLTFSYHDGPLLTGSVPVTLIWYGNFTPSHRAVVSDFVTSLSLPPLAGGQPSVATWWRTLETYYRRSKTPLPTLTPGAHILDESCSLGKSLSATDIARLAAKHRSKKRGIAVVLTADDVAVDGFCMSRCGSHGADERTKSAYIWVGNSAVQCPGQCAWPFHKPIYGPQAAALVAPNGDVGADGMVVNLASMVAGAVTNPFGGGFYQGPRAAPLEAATACAGVFGSGAYPGFAGELLVDAATGASYNAVGARGRKYLLPALFDPATSSCSTLV